MSPALRRRLERLIRQLDPRADAAACVEELARRLAPAPALEPGLLSVVVRHHSMSRARLLDEALFSLACGEHRPLEIVLSSQAPEPGAREALEALLARHAALGGDGVRTTLVHAPSARDERGRLANAGIDAARGQYLAFLDDDDVVYPSHHARLVDVLRGGEAAWAIGRARRVTMAVAPDGTLHCRAKEPWARPAGLDLPAFAKDNDVPVHAYVLDRARLAGLRVAFSEDVPRQEDYAFLLRLAGLFRPADAPGPAGCEYRFRDDGTNSTVHEEAPLGARLAQARTWTAARGGIARAKAEAQALLSMEELEALARPAPAAAGGREELRYRIADRVNDALKRLPGVHALVKAGLARRGR